MSLPSELVYTGEYSIRTYEIDNRKKATIPAIIKLMHEAAMQNVINMKVSVWDLEPYNISWVLMRKKMEVHRLPNLGEQIKVVTYPAGFEKFFTYRDYKVFDQENNLLAQAASTWLLMDTLSRKMTRIPAFILEKEMPDPSTCLTRPSGRLPKFGTVHHSKEFVVNWYDLDFNQHLNNVHYIQWMLETMEDKYLQNGKLANIDIQYRMESKWKDAILSQTEQIGDGEFLHRLIRQSDQKELVQAKTTWELE